MAVSQGDARTQTPGTTSFGTLVEWRARTRLFDSLVAYRDWGLPMTGAGDAELVRGLRVSAGFFDTLDVQMQRGCNFTEQEDHPNTSRVLILSDGFWKTRFGGSPAVIGQSITLGGVPFKIVGVLPAKFRALGFVTRPHRMSSGRSVTTFRRPLRVAVASIFVCLDASSLACLRRARKRNYRKSRVTSRALIQRIIRPTRGPCPFLFKLILSALPIRRCGCCSVLSACCF